MVLLAHRRERTSCAITLSTINSFAGFYSNAIARHSEPAREAVDFVCRRSAKRV
jgi:hypothetical protein